MGDPLVGTQVADRYRLDARIGKGGMGVVYRGVHLWTERAVAVKLLERGDSEISRKRFLNEARAAAAVRHPNLVEVLDVGDHGDSMYLVLELLEGESLSAHLKRKGKMRAEDALDALVPILDALEALHKQGILHRDVKPANMFLSSDGQGRVVPKLLDLGISKSLSGTQDMTHTGTLMGTPSYMSPEQACGDEVGIGADIWAMGVVLFEVLSGAKPFVAGTVPGLLHKIATQRPPSLATREPDLPRAIAHVVDRALAYEASTRHRSAKELADALVDAALTSGWPLTCRVPSGPRISLEPSLPHDTAPTATPTGRRSSPTPTKHATGDRAKSAEVEPAKRPPRSEDPNATPFDGSIDEVTPAEGGSMPTVPQGAARASSGPVTTPDPEPSAPETDSKPADDELSRAGEDPGDDEPMAALPIRSRAPWVLGGIAAAGLLAVGAWAMSGSTAPGPERATPRAAAEPTEPAPILEEAAAEPTPPPSPPLAAAPEEPRPPAPAPQVAARARRRPARSPTPPADEAAASGEEAPADVEVGPNSSLIMDLSPR